MNVISEAQLEYLRNEAKKALAAKIKSAQYYEQLAEKDVAAAERSSGAEQDKHIAAAERNAETSKRIEAEAETIGNLIDAQQAFIEAQQASMQSYGTERYIAGCNTAQTMHTADESRKEIQRHLDMERIGGYNAERYGYSTEGQWKTPMVLMRDGSIRPKYKQKINLAQYQ